MFISDRTLIAQSYSNQSKSIHKHHQSDPNQPRTVKATASFIFERGSHTAKRSNWKLNWVAGMTWPEISFHVSEISTKIKTATISDHVCQQSHQVFQGHPKSHQNTII